MHTKILNNRYCNSYCNYKLIKQHAYINMQQYLPSTYKVTTSLMLPTAKSLHVTVVLESPNVALSIVIVDGLSTLLPVVSTLG